MKRLAPKRCLECGEWFQPDLARRKFCSIVCASRTRRLVLPLDEMRADYARGLRVIDIVKKYGFAERTIYDHLAHDGRCWTRPGSRKPGGCPIKLTLPLDDMAKDREAGMTVARLEQKYGFAQRTIYRHFALAGRKVPAKSAKTSRHYQ